MKNKPRVYIAGPAGSLETRAVRVDNAIDVAEGLVLLGFVPFVPHTMFSRWEERHAHPYEFWMDLCFAWLPTCDACLRMPGASPGADREVAWCEANGVPVFRAFDDLIAWRDREVAA